MSRFSSDSSGLDGLSKEADTIDWDYDSDETDPEMIFHDSMGIDDDVSMKEEENIDLVVNPWSVIEDLPITEAFDTTLSDGIDSKGRYLLEVFGGTLAAPKIGNYMMIMIIGD